MEDITGYDGWYHGEVRRLKSADGLRQAIKHDGGWELFVVASDSMMMSNPFGVKWVESETEDEIVEVRTRISDESAIEYVRSGAMPPEFDWLPRDPEPETLYTKFMASVSAKATPT